MEFIADTQKMNLSLVDSFINVNLNHICKQQPHKEITS